MGQATLLDSCEIYVHLSILHTPFSSFLAQCAIHVLREIPAASELGKHSTHERHSG
jgi:hypothetical protein